MFDSESRYETDLEPGSAAGIHERLCQLENALGSVQSMIASVSAEVSRLRGDLDALAVGTARD